MNQLHYNQNSYLDIIFAGKNKSYGAYTLRKNYSQRMRRATLGGLLAISLLLSLATLRKEENQLINIEPIYREVDLADIYDKPQNKERIETPQMKTQSTPKQIQSKTPVITQDRNIAENENPRTEELEGAVISNSTQTGSGDPENFLGDVQLGRSAGDIGNAQIAEPTNLSNNDQILEFVTQDAQYPGGVEELLRDVVRNFEYTNLARSNGIEGRIILKFVVEKDGSISQIQVLQGLGYGLDESAIVALKKLKKFRAAKNDGMLVRSYFELPIRCRMN